MLLLFFLSLPQEGNVCIRILDLFELLVAETQVPALPTVQEDAHVGVPAFDCVIPFHRGRSITASAVADPQFHRAIQRPEKVDTLIGHRVGSPKLGGRIPDFNPDVVIGL
jgi:hypothetical protein